MTKPLVGKVTDEIGVGSVAGEGVVNAELTEALNEHEDGVLTRLLRTCDDGADAVAVADDVIVDDFVAVTNFARALLGDEVDFDLLAVAEDNGADLLTGLDLAPDALEIGEIGSGFASDLFEDVTGEEVTIDGLTGDDLVDPYAFGVVSDTGTEGGFAGENVLLF